MIRDFPRRQFIRATGMLWSLSYGDERKLLNLGGDDDEQSESRFPRQEVAEEDVTPWAFIEHRRGSYGSLKVSVDPENALSSVVLEGVMDRSDVAFGLDPEQARELADELMEAADEVEAAK